MSDKSKTKESLDQSAKDKNPNNDAHKAAQDNKSNQQNPNHAASKQKGK